MNPQELSLDGFLDRVATNYDLFLHVISQHPQITGRVAGLASFCNLTGGKGWYRANILWFFRPALRPRKLHSQMAQAERFEHSRTVLETVMLPLHQAHIWLK